MKIPEGDWFANVNDRPHPWPGLTWLTPALVVDDVDAAVSFYCSTIGFAQIFVLRADGEETLFARLRYRGTNVTLNRTGFDSDLQQPSETDRPPFIFYLYVDDVDATARRMRDAGATIVSEPTAQFWGDLKARVVDPFGYLWDVAERLDP